MGKGFLIYCSTRGWCNVGWSLLMLLINLAGTWLKLWARHKSCMDALEIRMMFSLQLGWLTSQEIFFPKYMWSVFSKISWEIIHSTLPDIERWYCCGPILFITGRILGNYTCVKNMRRRKGRRVQGSYFCVPFQSWCSSCNDMQFEATWICHPCGFFHSFHAATQFSASLEFSSLI